MELQFEPVATRGFHRHIDSSVLTRNGIQPSVFKLVELVTVGLERRHCCLRAVGDLVVRKRHRVPQHVRRVFIRLSELALERVLALDIVF